MLQPGIHHIAVGVQRQQTAASVEIGVAILLDDVEARAEARARHAVGGCGGQEVQQGGGAVVAGELRGDRDERDGVRDLGGEDRRRDARIRLTQERAEGVVGVDIDPQRIKEATENVRKAGVQDRVTLIRGDIFDPAIKIGEASVVTLYLLPSLNQKLMPRLKGELKAGTRIVSHAFSMGDSWPAEKEETADGTTIYLWTIK